MIHYTIRLPDFSQLDGGGRRMERYYDHLANRLRRRWQGEGYLLACLDFASCNEKGRLFVPWQGMLVGEDCVVEGEVVTVQLQYREVRGGKTGEIALCDRWNLPWGSPVADKKRRFLGGRNKN